MPQKWIIKTSVQAEESLRQDKERGTREGNCLVADQKSDGPRLHSSSEHWALGPRPISLSLTVLLWSGDTVLWKQRFEITGWRNTVLNGICAIGT